MFAGAIFAAIFLGVAITGFTSLGEITDARELAVAKGFAWFWGFLGSVAFALAVLAWWFGRTYREDEDA